MNQCPLWIDSIITSYMSYINLWSPFQRNDLDVSMGKFWPDREFPPLSGFAVLMLPAPLRVLVFQDISTVRTLTVGQQMGMESRYRSDSSVFAGLWRKVIVAGVCGTVFVAGVHWIRVLVGVLIIVIVHRYYLSVHVVFVRFWTFVFIVYSVATWHKVLLHLEEQKEVYEYSHSRFMMYK